MRFLRKLNGSLCRLKSGTGKTIVKAAPAVKMGSVVSMDRAFFTSEESNNDPKNMQNSLSPGILVSLVSVMIAIANESGNARPAYFDSSTDQWVDLETGTALTASETGSLRHYQMVITYDDRVRTQDTQPPGLPRGKGTIFGGLKYWEEVPPSKLMMVEKSVVAAPLN